MGIPKFVTADMAEARRRGRGYRPEYENGSCAGDVDFRMWSLSPPPLPRCPAGVGPMTIAMLDKKHIPGGEAAEYD